MSRIIFLTSGPINYQFKDANLYKSIVETSLGLRYPSLKVDAEPVIKKVTERIKEKRFILPGAKIVSASSRQAIETAKLIGRELSLSVKIDKRLEAINFDFSRIMSEDEFSRLGSKAFDVARPRFLKEFFEDQLLESKLSVKKRIDLFLNEYSANDETVLAISHSFLLAIINSYLKKGEQVFSDFTLLEKCFCPQKRPFGFLEGFIVDFSSRKNEAKINMLIFSC